MANDNRCACGNPHDNWPGKDGSLLCQDCWEKQCDESWWIAVKAADAYMAAIEEASNGR